MSKTVIDIFCGAGGFSAGFYFNGFEIVSGIDNWQPAINTFNFNYGLNCKTTNVLEFENDVEQIMSLPNTNIILGSPPCVSFSNSNKSGKADKTMGVRLTEIFLKIVAVKKFCKGSILEGWFMENVPNSAKYLRPVYTFRDLNLSKWANGLGYKSNQIAINIFDNSKVLISSDYGCPQVRKRLITNENIIKSNFVNPLITHSEKGIQLGLNKWVTLSDIKKKLPFPNSSNSQNLIKDPLYPEIQIPLCNLTDQFYDSGLYKSQWEQSKFLKTNHPFMGKMSFPENLERPSRTITATNISSSREAIVYRSEFNRYGDGEYRLPTIREMASLMGFPITYQFIGKLNSKKKLVGNAVCPTLSNALAKKFAIDNEIKCVRRNFKLKVDKLTLVGDLNTFSVSMFDSPPERSIGVKFRRHPFKDGNITVTLSNFEIGNKSVNDLKWQTSIQYGNGKGFPNQIIPDFYYESIEPLISNFDNGRKLIGYINDHFLDKISDSKTLQRLYEKNISDTKQLSPIDLVEVISDKIESFDLDEVFFEQKDDLIFKHKSKVPVKQLFALYAINVISSTTNTL